jgi:hypothetical protein
VSDQKGDTGSCDDFPSVCVHCGGAATPVSPVLPLAIEGETFLLHPACRAEWLGDAPNSKFAIPADNSVPQFLRRPMPPEPGYLTDDDQKFIDDGKFK